MRLSQNLTWNIFADESFAAKSEFDLEYFRSLQKENNWESKKIRKEEKLEVMGKRVSPRVIRQVSGSERLKFMAEHWVFIPRFGHVT